MDMMLSDFIAIRIIEGDVIAGGKPSLCGSLSVNAIVSYHPLYSPLRIV
jgi:hypothetical protein